MEEFTYEFGSVEAEEADIEFNAGLRRWIILMTLYFTLYTLWVSVLYRYLRRDGADGAVGLTDTAASQLAIVLCAVCLMFASAATMLVPLTVLFNQIVIEFGDNVYLEWATQDVLQDFWNVTFLGAHISFLLVLPLAYFYEEAADGTPNRSRLARVSEALLSFTLTSTIIIGSVLMLMSLSSTDMQHLLPFTYSLFATVGSLLVLASIPYGFTYITRAAVSAYRPGMRRARVTEQLMALDLEIAALTQRMELYELSARELADVRRSIAATREQRRAWAKYQVVPPAVYNASVLLTAAASVTLAALVVVNAFLNFLNTDPLSNPDGTTRMRLSFTELFFSRTFSSALDVLATVYMISSAFAGLYRLPLLSRYLRFSAESGVTIQTALGNTAVLLLVSASFPVVARILDLTHYSSLGYYRMGASTHSRSFMLVYKSVFVGVLGNTVYQFIRGTLRRLREQWTEQAAESAARRKLRRRGGARGQPQQRLSVSSRSASAVALGVPSSPTAGSVLTPTSPIAGAAPSVRGASGDGMAAASLVRPFVG